MSAFGKAFNIKNAVGIFIPSWDDVSLASTRHASWRVVGDNTEPANNNEKEVDKQVAETVLIAQRIPGFDGVTEDEVVGIVQTKEQEPTGEDMMEEANEQEQEEELKGKTEKKMQSRERCL